MIANFQPVLFCHDQEPLNFDFYKDSSILQQPLLEQVRSHQPNPVDDLNLRLTLPGNWRKNWVLLHSEINSAELEKYENTGRYKGAYYWSHALLARDWYRYAEHDPLFCYPQDLPKQQTFLIYARDTSGSREYRRYFLDCIAQNLSSVPGSLDDIEINGDSSAMYHARDFLQTDISLVLETIYENRRIHLTEKILRPIACGHPFILAAGPGSLDVLKKYGFKTFDPWIDESYDRESDPRIRADMIIKEMIRIESLDQASRNHMIRSCQEIARYNRELFFSQKFLDFVVNELKDNVDQANDYMLDPRYYLESRRWFRRNNPEHIPNQHLRSFNLELARYVRINQGSFKQYQRHQHSLDDKSSADGNNV